MGLRESTKLKYLQIAEDLRFMISRKHLPHNSVIPSANDIIKKYQCSMTTANKALNLLADSGLIIRVKGSGNFVNKPEKEQKTLNIGLADDISKETNPIRRAMMEIFPASALTYFRSHNCNCKFIPYFIIKENDISFFKELDGLLISCTYIDDLTLPFIRSLKIPIVIYRSEYEYDQPYTQIIPDWNVGAEELFNAARMEKIDKIIICHTQYQNSLARVNVFRKHALNCGFTTDQITEIEIPNNQNIDFPLNKNDFTQNTLLISCTALYTVMLISELAKLDLYCPDDYHFICADDASKLWESTPGLSEITSIDYSHRDAAYIAASKLISMAAKGVPTHYQTIKIPTRLIIRESGLKNYKGDIL